MKRFRFLTFTFFVLLAFAASRAQQAAAASCTASASPLNFGAYDPLSPHPADSSADVDVTCSRSGSGAESVNYVIKLSAGNGTYDARKLMSGPNALSYNLYIVLSRAPDLVWGDGSGVSYYVAGAMSPLNDMTPRLHNVHPVYGRIDARQSVPGGLYSDVIVVTVEFF